MRTMLCSSSNRHSASAFASSVLPTPVGPRNRKLPIGRFGSAMPARERRMASRDLLHGLVLTDDAAGGGSSSRCRSFSRSPSTSFATGIPVQRATMSAISSSVTVSRTQDVLLLLPPRSLHGLGELLLQRGQLGILQPCRLLVLVRAAAPSRCRAFIFSISALELLDLLGTLFFSVSQRAFISLNFSFCSASSSVELCKTVLRELVVLLLERHLLDFELHDLAADVVELARAWSRSPCGSWRTPHPQGRWPYRAGNGR